MAFEARGADGNGQDNALRLICATFTQILHTSELDVANRKLAETATTTKTRRLSRAPTHASIALEDARRAGLLDGDRTEHLSFRVPKALLDAARRELGATSPTEIGIAALALLAQPDPVAQFMKKTRGRLGPDHTLDI